MSTKQPRYAIGDSVCERVLQPGAGCDTGTVIERYAFESDYRYVVKFESGREEVFFERELLSVPSE